MQLPAIIIKGEGIFQTIYNPTAFYYGSGDDAILHPAAAWNLWTAADWADMCPDWQVLPLLDSPPVEVGKRAVRRPIAEWLIEADAVKVTYELVDLTPAEIEAAKPPVPAAVTNFQARAVLLAAGLFDQVDAAIKAQPVNSNARQAWEYANELTRNGTLVNSVSETLGLTAAQLDDLFRQAAKIEA
ncbi:MAG: hypothetical protein ACLGJC_28045 [Alphaproteobacteria bacterium]